MASIQSPTPGRANQACKRCHGRKKRCNRSLPQCEGCQLASVRCSFQENTEKTRVYAISYVRGLEERIQQLENQLRDSNSPLQIDNHILTTVYDSVSPPSSTNPAVSMNSSGKSLASELKSLSLEATAERYLGSSSGLSFAQLTQAVLRRLKSDQYPFAFETNSVNDNFQCHDNDETSSEPVHDHDRCVSEPLDISSLIARDHAFRLTEYYWSHNHTLYPFVRKVAFRENLNRMYTNADCIALRSHSWLYTMWMVLAIGSTAWSSITIDGEIEPAEYFNRAMQHFEGALSFGVTSTLSAVLLQVSYSFFNKVGPNTWYLVGVGLRVAIGMGLHTAPSRAVLSLPLNVQEYRKRIFYSLYMMDRVVSIALGRPFGIQDHDIEVDIFSNAEDENILPHTIIPQSPLRPSLMTIPLHILALRKISAEIFEQIYSRRNRDVDSSQQDAILQRIHQKLIDWRRNMPFPLPQAKSLPIPHFTTAWYDLNYYQHILMLYRPSPLFPILTLEKVGLIAEASAMFISQVSLMQQQKCYAFNWLNLFHVFTAALSLIYSITAQPEPLPVYLQRSNALTDLKVVGALLSTFGHRFPSALKCRDIVQDVVGRLESLTDVGSPPTLPTTSTVAQEIVAGMTHEPHPDTDVAYPVYETGNTSYDELQHQVIGSKFLERSAEQDFALSAEDPALVIAAEGFGCGSTPFGTAAAQFMAAGLGASADMDLDEDMLHFIGSTGGNWEL